MKRTFGIEIEFRDCFYSDVRNSIQQLSLSYPFRCQRIKENPKQPGSKGKFWHLKYDKTASVKKGNRWTGGELCSPAFYIQQKNFDEIRFCLDTLLECKPTYDSETGLHIHINIDDIDRLKFLAIWAKYEGDIYKIFKDRRNGGYTLPEYPLNDRTVNQDIMNKMAMLFLTNSTMSIFGSKNHALHFYERGPLNFVEIRVCEMSKDTDLLIGWMKLALQMIERSNEFKDTLSILYYDLPNDILDFCSNRYDQLILTDSEKLAIRRKMQEV